MTGFTSNRKSTHLRITFAILTFVYLAHGWGCASGFTVRQDPHEDKMGEHQNDHPETATLLQRGTMVLQNQGVSTQSGDACADSRWENPGSGGSPNNWLRTLRDDLAFFQSTEGSTTPHCSFAVETVLLCMKVTVGGVPPFPLVGFTTRTSDSILYGQKCCR